MVDTPTNPPSQLHQFDAFWFVDVFCILQVKAATTIGVYFKSETVEAARRVLPFRCQHTFDFETNFIELSLLFLSAELLASFLCHEILLRPIHS